MLSNDVCTVSAAVFVSLRSILLVELLGIEMLTKSFGILILFQGIATMVGAPLAGTTLCCFRLSGWCCPFEVFVHPMLKTNKQKTHHFTFGQVLIQNACSMCNQSTRSIFRQKKKSETKLTAYILKEDQNTRKLRNKHLF